MSKYNILLVDDLEDNLLSTKDLLQRWDYNVDAVSSGDEAIECIRSSSKEYAVVLLDYRMPGKTGPETATEIRALNEEVVLLIYSAYPSVESLRATIRAGILNFIDKNEDMDYLRSALSNACGEFEKTRRVKPPLSEDEATQLIGSINMVGRSPGLAAVAAKVKRYRGSSRPVLILGETGAGKELIAKALHTDKPEKFLVVNCAALQDGTLVESELFGYEKGAFTGAANRKDGIFTAAAGGTVYLDELHFLDLKTQGKLLRVIRERKIRRVGGNREEDVNFRLVASTWPDIEDKVKKGTFLPDLYYRLKILKIEIPPLRDRPEDIEPLVLFFCENYFKETGIRKQFLKRAMRCLEKYPWPGNVGELDGCVAELLANCTRASIDESQLDPHLREGGSDIPGASFAQLEVRQDKEKRQLIQKTLKSSNSVLHAAERLGLKPSSLHTLITRLGMRS